MRTGAGSNTASYTYDKNGNRTSDTWDGDPATTYTYNAGNQVTSGGHTPTTPPATRPTAAR